MQRVPGRLRQVLRRLQQVQPARVQAADQQMQPQLRRGLPKRPQMQRRTPWPGQAVLQVQQLQQTVPKQPLLLRPLTLAQR